MKYLRYALIVVLLVALATAGVALAAVDTFTSTPTSAPQTTETDWTLEYSFTWPGAGTDIAFCLYYEEGETWNARFVAITEASATGDNYTAVNSDLCPTLAGYDSIYYYVVDSANFQATETERITWDNVTVPAGATVGVHDFFARVYTGSDCSNAVAGDGADDPGGATCGTTQGGGKFHQFTVESDPATIYVSDSGTCGGYGDVGQDCYQSLDTALSKANTFGSTTIRVVGDLTLDNNGSDLSGAGSLSAFNGLSTPRLISPGTCTGTAVGDGTFYMLDVDRAVTVSDITFVGTACNTASVIGVRLSDASATINNVTVQNFDATSQIGVKITVAGTLSNSTIQSNTTGVVSAGSTISGNTISSNSGVGLSITGGTPTVSGNTISSNGGDGINSDQTGGTFQDNDVTSNTGDGIQVPAGFAGTILENHITGSGGYGVNFGGAPNAAIVLKYNNIYSNTTGQLVNGSSVAVGGNYLGDNATSGTYGGFDGAIVGSPFTRTTPGISTANIYTQDNLADGNDCSDPSSHYTTVGPIQLCNNTGDNTLDFVIVDLGTDTPFGIGTDPDQGQQCSNYYDVYVDHGTANTGQVWVMIPVKAGLCQSTYVPANCSDVPHAYINSGMSRWSQTESWSCVPNATSPTKVTGYRPASTLGDTGFVVLGDNAPTAITLLGLSAKSQPAANPIALAVAGLLLVVLLGLGVRQVVRRRI
ncbi:MAG: right-handed parallel beta-helix repeat-containing protein [Chloroflexota bacterium]